MTAAEIAAEIANLEQMLNAGVSTVSSDNETVTFDQKAIRKRLQELRAMQTNQAYRQRRVRTFDLRDAF